jgi:hypothetical protein
VSARLVKVAFAVSLAIFFWKAFLPGWATQTTDFPNYYTAARLAREGAPLRLDYDWTWFQRQIDRAGIEGQLGGYIPQTPLTMLPVVPLSFLTQQAAKRGWLVFNLLCLALTIQLLWRMTGFHRIWLWLLIFVSWAPLRANFQLGQYYIFLLLLLTLTAYTSERNREGASGALAGIAFGLKLYGAPLLLWFAMQRRWRAVAGMVASTLACIGLAILLFGWQDVAYFTTQVMPRALEGETLNPFHPGNGTFSTLLRIVFVPEPELNPHPVVHAPVVFFFLQPVLALTVLAIPLLAAGSFGWFVTALLLASPNTASYTFVLLALPLALLLKSSPRSRWPWLLLPYIAIGLPLPSAWAWMFPRLWLLLAIYLAAGSRQWETIRLRHAVAAGVVILAFATVSASVRLRDYEDQPGRKYELAVNEPGAVFSGVPVVAGADLLYQSIANDRYAIRRLRDAKPETFAFPGEAFTPAASSRDNHIWFEQVLAGHSRIAMFDPDSHRLETVPVALPDPREPAVSHDGNRFAFVSGDSVYVDNRRVPAPGPASDPSFTPDDRGVVFSAGSRVLVFDGTLHTIFSGAGPVSRASLSPDGTQLLFASTATGSSQVWVADLTTGHAARLTGGKCNNSAPAWGAQPGQFIFASDCGRGLGLPALYLGKGIANTGPVILDTKPPRPLASSRKR